MCVFVCVCRKAQPVDSKDLPVSLFLSFSGFGITIGYLPGIPGGTKPCVYGVDRHTGGALRLLGGALLSRFTSQGRRCET